MQIIANDYFKITNRYPKQSLKILDRKTEDIVNVFTLMMNARFPASDQKGLFPLFRSAIHKNLSYKLQI